MYLWKENVADMDMQVSYLRRLKMILSQACLLEEVVSQNLNWRIRHNSSTGHIKRISDIELANNVYKPLKAGTDVVRQFSFKKVVVEYV